MDRPNQEGSSQEIRRNSIRDSAILNEIHHRRNPVRVPEASGISVTDIQAPISAVRSRPHLVPSERFQRAYRARRRDRPSVPGNSGSIQQAVERLNEASSSLSSLLDHPTPHPDIRTRSHSEEADANQRRAKRRRLDGDPYAMEHMSFSYGHHGQVVPGALQMEIVSCDGGLHGDFQQGRAYCPENILRNDKSVYCTDNSKCNIIMRHLGGATFCLRKIVIKAPERGFTAPIQEGLIFVSMKLSLEQLLEQTAQYHVRETSPLRSTSPIYVNHARRTTTPLNTSREPNENRPPSRRAIDMADRAVPRPISNIVSDSDRGYTLHSYSDLQDPNFHIICDNLPRPLQRISPPTPLPFTVTTDCSDHSQDEEEESTPAILADRFRRDLMPPGVDDSGSDSTDDGDLSRYVVPGTRRPPRRRNGRRTVPSRIEVMVPSAADTARTKPPSEILPPHAKFFIEKDKNTISIKFEPLVSGTLILLKLWSPIEDQNIDIQSIMVYGYAGPRFFPAAQPM